MRFISEEALDTFVGNTQVEIGGIKIQLERKVHRNKTNIARYAIHFKVGGGVEVFCILERIAD